MPRLNKLKMEDINLKYFGNEKLQKIIKILEKIKHIDIQKTISF